MSHEHYMYIYVWWEICKLWNLNAGTALSSSQMSQFYYFTPLTSVNKLQNFFSILYKGTCSIFTFLCCRVQMNWNWNLTIWYFGTIDSEVARHGWRPTEFWIQQDHRTVRWDCGITCMVIRWRPSLSIRCYTATATRINQVCINENCIKIGIFQSS